MEVNRPLVAVSSTGLEPHTVEAAGDLATSTCRSKLPIPKMVSNI